MIELAVSGRAKLRLSNDWDWSEPAVDGDSIEVFRVRYESDPGYGEWELRGRRTGRSTLTAEGRGTADRVRRFRLVVVVP